MVCLCCRIARPEIFYPANVTPRLLHKMTSTKNPQECILEDGAFWVEDPIIGRRVDEIAEKGFPFKTKEGLEFCKVNTLDDKVGGNAVYDGRN